MSDRNIVSLVPFGKIRCFVTGKLRKDTPEENVRQRWARSLVEEYRYKPEDIGVEFTIRMGRARKKSDLVVFHEGQPHKQEHIFIIIEAKRDDVKPKDKKEGVEQLKSYMHASPCRYGLWVGSERLGFEQLPEGTLVDGIADIPSQGTLKPVVPVYRDLVPALDLRAIFRRCHNYIYANQGLQKAEAFHEMLKLIFCKVHDETESTGQLQFYIQNDERRSVAGQRRVRDDRVTPLFNSVKQRYPYIFRQHESVDLAGHVLAYIVSELQRLSLLQTRTDIKGSAYEELVGANLRGDRGEYFTPRNVCDMAVKMAMATYPAHRLSGLRVFDPCCGTGGFLVSYINEMRIILRKHEATKTGHANEHEVARRIRDICTQHLFGIDINPFLVRTCQMNLVMHGDGSANVFHANSLLSPGEWSNEDATRGIPYGQLDLVITNPPFGGKAVVDDPHLLSKYELAGYGAANSRSLLPAEQIFVEGALRYLKPGGRLAIVLPDSILNNPSLEFIRRWLAQRTRILATVDLPKETFATSGGVPNPSVLIVQKLASSEIALLEAGVDHYPVFMAIPRSCGIDKRGNPVYQRSPDGLDILDAESGRIINDEIALVAKAFVQWVENVTFGN